jgi:hypothetical protein
MRCLWVTMGTAAVRHTCTDNIEPQFVSAQNQNSSSLLKLVLQWAWIDYYSTVVGPLRRAAIKHAWMGSECLGCGLGGMQCLAAAG